MSHWTNEIRVISGSGAVVEADVGSSAKEKIRDKVVRIEHFDNTY